MSIVELVPVAAPVDDEQEGAIVRAVEDGFSIASIARQFGLRRHEVDAVLDRALPRIDASCKRRSIALAAARLDELTEVFHKLAKTGDIEAGNLCVRFEAERRALLGFTGAGYDPTQLLAVSDQRQIDPEAYQQVLQRLGFWPGQPEEPGGNPAEVDCP
jgi:hypothetical protein